MSEIDFKKMAKEDMQDLQGNETISEFIADLYERLYLTDPQFRQDVNESSDKPTLYVHDFDVKVQIASFAPKGGDLYSGELKKRIIKSLENMDDRDFWEVCDCIHSVGSDQHGTTASDWGINADSD